MPSNVSTKRLEILAKNLQVIEAVFGHGISCDEAKANAIAEFEAEEAVRTSWLITNAEEVSAMVRDLTPSNLPGARNPQGFVRVSWSEDEALIVKPRVSPKPGDEDGVTRPYSVYVEEDENDGWLPVTGREHPEVYVRDDNDDEEPDEIEIEGVFNIEPEFEIEDEGPDTTDFYPMPGHPATAFIVPGRIKNTRMKSLMESIAGVQPRFWKSITMVSLVINKEHKASISLTTAGGANLVFSIEDFGRMFSVPSCNEGQSRIIFPTLRHGTQTELYAWITVLASFTIGGNFIGGGAGPDFRIKSI